MKLPVLFAAVALGVTPATAHDTYANGIPVPAWVKGRCCGVSDLHRYTAEEVHQDEHGSWILPDYPNPIPDNDANVFASQDGYYYAFFRTDAPDSAGKIYHSPVFCFFKPLSG